jgi:NADH-quinone oxidoreductase subunit K
MTPVVVVCAAVFSLGLYGVLARRDLVAILACIELMLGAANVQLVAFASASPKGNPAAQGLALAFLVLAAAEASVGLALVLATAKRTGKARIEELTEVNG